MNEDKKIYCTQCGGENNGTAKFCSNCGAKLEQPAAAADTASTNVYADGLFSGESTTSSYERITDAEEIKPEGSAAQEEIKINYGYSQSDYSQNDYSQNSNTYNSDPVYSYSSNQNQYYSAEDTGKVTGGNIGVSIASLVCGIFSIICCCATYFALVLAIAAIVLGIIAIVKKYDGQGMAIAGIATGGVGVVIAIFTIIIALTSYGTSDFLEEILNEFNS